MAGGEFHDEVQRLISSVQMQESVRMYNDVVEKAFRKCVFNFRSSSLTEDEKTCVSDHTMRLLRSTQRVKLRIQEIQEQKQEELKKRMKEAVGKDVSLPTY